MARHHIPSNQDDVIDSRDVIARIEELESERDSFEPRCAGCGETQCDSSTDECKAEVFSTWAEENEDDASELKALLALQDEASGSPDWRHGEALIRDSYFETYAEELAEDCGMITRGAQWPNNCIDWEEAADQLKDDYTSVDFGGETYWIRS